MRTRSLVISATLISALVLALAVIALAADNPFVGTWKMNPAKSKFSYAAIQELYDRQSKPKTTASRLYKTSLMPMGRPLIAVGQQNMMVRITQ